MNPKNRKKNFRHHIFQTTVVLLRYSNNIQERDNSHFENLAAGRGTNARSFRRQILRTGNAFTQPTGNSRQAEADAQLFVQLRRFREFLHARPQANETFVFIHCHGRLVQFVARAVAAGIYE
jgi:hypothetical protein